MKQKVQKVHIQAWIEPRLLADLVHWLLAQEKEKFALATPAYVFARLIEVLHQSIKKQFDPHLFTENSEALHYLTQHGFMPRAGISSIRGVRPIEIDLCEEDSEKIAADLLEIMEGER